MIEGFKIPQVTFRIREGDTSDNEIACAIGGKWTNKSTDDFLKKVESVNIEEYKVNSFVDDISNRDGTYEEDWEVEFLS